MVAAVQLELLSKSVLRRSEVTLRESMAQNNHAIVAGLALGSSEHAAESGLRSQHRKEVRIGKGHDERLRPATPAELHSTPTVDGYGFENIIMLPPIEVVRS